MWGVRERENRLKKFKNKITGENCLIAYGFSHLRLFSVLFYNITKWLFFFLIKEFNIYFKEANFIKSIFPSKYLSKIA